MRRLLLFALLLSASSVSWGADCSTYNVAASKGNGIAASVDCTHTVKGDDYTLNDRQVRVHLPQNYAADFTHSLVISLHGSSSANNPASGWEANTSANSGWSDFCDGLSAAKACGVMYGNALYGSRFHVQSIRGNTPSAGIATVYTAEVNDQSYGNATNVSRTSNTNILTFDNSAHQFVTSNTIITSGFSDPSFNGTFTVTATTTSSVTFTTVGLPDVAPTAMTGLLVSTQTISISGASIAGFNDTSAVATPLGDGHSFTYVNPTGGTAGEVGFVGSINKSWGGYITRTTPDFADDVAYLNTMLGVLLPILKPDPNRIYITGWSSGAYMSFRYAIERPDLIAAVGSAEGTIGTYPPLAISSLATIPDTSRPFSVIGLSGTSDSVVINCGGGIRQNFNQQSSLGDTPTYLARNMKCTTVPADICVTGTPTTATLTCPSTNKWVATTAASFGQATAPPNNGIRTLEVIDSINFPSQFDASLSSTTTTTATINNLTTIYGGTNGPICTTGASTTAQVQIRPYMPNGTSGHPDNRQISWLATNCRDQVELQFYSLLGGGHTYYGTGNDLHSFNASIPAGKTATQLFWDFFDAHPKRSTSGFKSVTQ